MLFFSSLMGSSIPAPYLWFYIFHFPACTITFPGHILALGENIFAVIA
jgi:hypothetical protein